MIVKIDNHLFVDASGLVLFDHGCQITATINSGIQFTFVRAARSVNCALINKNPRDCFSGVSCR